MNPTLGKYMRLRLDDSTWDMSLIGARNSIGLARPQIQSTVGLNCTGVSDAIAYLGPHIITVNEV